MPSANKEVPHILWNPAAHYHIHKSPLTLPILCQIDQVYDPITLLENYKIILSSVTKYSRGLFPSVFPGKTLYAPLCENLMANS